MNKKKINTNATKEKKLDKSKKKIIKASTDTKKTNIEREAKSKKGVSVIKSFGSLSKTTKLIIYTATASAIVLPTAIFATYAITKSVVSNDNGSGGLNPGGNPGGENPDGSNPGGNNPGGSIPGGGGTPAWPSSPQPPAGGITNDQIETRDPADVTIINAQKDKITTEADRLSSVGLTLSPTNALVFPQTMKFTGTEGDGTIVPINLNDLGSKYEIAYYDPNGVRITTLSKLGITNGSKIMALAFDKTNNFNFVTGKTYTVHGLTSNAPKITGGFDDKGFFKKLLNDTATIEDVYAFTDTLYATNTYNSLVGYGTKGMLLDKLPDGQVIDSTWDRQPDHIYAPFLDTVWAMNNFNQPYQGFRNKAHYLASRHEFLSLGFIQGSLDENVRTTWGGAISINGDAQSADTSGFGAITLINEVRQAGGDVMLSFGGLTGEPIWVHTDPLVLARQLEFLVRSFKLNILDYDIEAAALSDLTATKNLAIATSIVQRKFKKEGRNLDISLTLPSEYNGFPAVSSDTVKVFLDNGVYIRKFNGMTMMMNPAHVPKGELYKAMNTATEAIVSQIILNYKDIGVTLTRQQAYTMAGATFDISSDTWINEQINEQGLRDIYKWANDKNLGFLAQWAVNNDEDGIINGAGTSAMHFEPGKAREILMPYNAAKRNFVDVVPFTSFISDAQLVQKLKSNYVKNADAPSTGGYPNAKEPNYLGSLNSGDIIKYPHPDTGVLHYWRATYWAGASERPGPTAQTPGQFTDLGPVDGASASSGVLDTIGDELLKIGSAIQRVGATSDIQLIMNDIKHMQDTGNIVVYSNTKGYKAGDVVLYNGTLWKAKWVTNIGDYPREVPSGVGSWIKISTLWQVD